VPPTVGLERRHRGSSSRLPAQPNRDLRQRCLVSRPTTSVPVPEGVDVTCPVAFGWNETVHVHSEAVRVHVHDATTMTQDYEQLDVYQVTSTSQHGPIRSPSSSRPTIAMRGISCCARHNRSRSTSRRVGENFHHRNADAFCGLRVGRQGSVERSWISCSDARLFPRSSARRARIYSHGSSRC
jgi:hypothetical protein